MAKLLVVLFVSTAILLAASKLAQQTVYTWPDGYDATGAHWYLYNFTKGAQTHWLGETMIGCGKDDFMQGYDLIWNFGDIGNFNAGDDAWNDGDIIIWFGSWDSAYAAHSSGYGSNAGHTGYVWFSSNIVDRVADPWLWPDRHAQIMPKPIVSQERAEAQPGSVIVEIPNLSETGASSEDYTILGYWIVANADISPEHPTGAPDDFTYTLGFVAQQGGPGLSTFFKYSPSDVFGSGNWNTYHAYYIVFRPDTTSGDKDVIPGYSTQYMSQNSDETLIFGVEPRK